MAEDKSDKNDEFEPDNHGGDEQASAAAKAAAAPAGPANVVEGVESADVKKAAEDNP